MVVSSRFEGPEIWDSRRTPSARMPKRGSDFDHANLSALSATYFMDVNLVYVKVLSCNREASSQKLHGVVCNHAVAYLPKQSNTQCCTQMNTFFLQPFIYTSFIYVESY